MAGVLLVAWAVIGVVTVPLILGYINNHGDAMIRDPAMETFVGLFFGPIPLLMFCAYFLLRLIGRAVFWVTGQTEDRA